MRAGANSNGGEYLSGGGLVQSYGGWEEITRLRQAHRVCIGDEGALGDSYFVERAFRAEELVIESRSRLVR